MAKTTNSDVIKVVDREAAVSKARELPKWLGYAGKVLLFVTAMYHLAAAGYRPLPGIQHTAVHLGLGMAIVMLYFPWFKKVRDRKWMLAMDVCAAVFSMINMFYVAVQYATLNERIGFAPGLFEVIMGVLTLAILFVCAYRTMGLAFPMIAGVFVVYMFIGPKLPGAFSHVGTSIPKFVSSFYLTMNGIYGSITKTSADVIILFIMFSSVIKYSPIGDFIMELATAALGKFRGGPAKVACVSSALMGMLSGSAVANVAGTGCITIPMMKKVGYPAKFAGAVESAASTGGQIMPPVMGGSVFIMVELIGISYNNVILIALPIALLYYAGLLLSIDLKAVAMNLEGIDTKERPRMRTTLKTGWYLIAPIALLIFLLAQGYSAQKSGFWAIIAAIVVSFISPKERMTVKKMFTALMEGVKDASVIFAVVGLASLIQGIVTVSGLGLRLSGILVGLADGRVLLLLLLTATASIILGMGLPVIVCYSFLALLIAPGLIELGVPAVAAHMFIFYYGCLSSITPPVAMASLVAAGIAKSNPMETALEACKVAFPIFFIPFFFIYSPDVLLMDGFSLGAVRAYFSVFLGLYATSCGFNGAALPKIQIPNMVLRIALVIVGVLILVPINGTDIAGIIILGMIQTGILIKSKTMGDGEVQSA